MHTLRHTIPSGVTTYNSRECSSTWVIRAGAGMESANDWGDSHAPGSDFARSSTPPDLTTPQSMDLPTHLIVGRKFDGGASFC
ncbi:MAG: hypothetical protein H0U76_24355 [Ktedonobacteraceae bacterium]|nr:hypothetical protein [Ktedonobacteraceae bacterium]